MFKKIISISICTLAAIGLSTSSSNGQTRIYVNEYLNIGVGGRGLAMGGAQTASSEDVFSTYWNPAGLSYIKHDFQIGGMHAEYFGGISKYDFVSFAKPFAKKDGKERVFSAAFIRFGTDNIPYTLDYVRPDGSFDESKLKGIGAGDYAGYFSYAQKINIPNRDDLDARIGISTKILYRHIGSMAKSWGVGLDVGFQMKYKDWKLGATLKDATNTYTSWSFNLTEKEKSVFGETGNEIPIKSYEVMRPRLNLGASYNLLSANKDIDLLAELGMDMTLDGKRKTIVGYKAISIDPKIGFEAAYKQMVFLRAGINNFYSVYDNSDTANKQTRLMYQPSIGVGLKLNSFVIDYSFTSLQVQGAPLMSHIISARFDMNKAKETRRRRHTPAPKRAGQENTTKQYEKIIQK